VPAAAFPFRSRPKGADLGAGAADAHRRPADSMGVAYEGNAIGRRDPGQRRGLRDVCTTARPPSTADARASLGTIVNDVNRTREYVVVERGGLPVAVIMDIDEFEDYLELRDPKTRERIATASREHRAGMSVPARDLLADLQRESPALSATVEWHESSKGRPEALHLAAALR